MHFSSLQSQADYIFFSREQQTQLKNKEGPIKSSIHYIFCIKLEICANNEPKLPALIHFWNQVDINLTSIYKWKCKVMSMQTNP